MISKKNLESRIGAWCGTWGRTSQQCYGGNFRNIW